jgi:Tfp pilus assembly protein PilE
MKIKIGFLTRSRERDAAADTARRNAIELVIRSQRQNAQRELQGLAARMQDFYSRTSFALQEAADFEVRSEKEESHIASLEREGTAARARLKKLESEMALFDKLLSTLTEIGE